MKNYTEGDKQKVGRLRRTIREHKQNCWKAQRAKLQLRHMIHKHEFDYEPDDELKNCSQFP